MTNEIDRFGFPAEDDEEQPKRPDIAVALRYEQEKDSAPVVVAKGRGLLAERIVEIAQENDIVIDTSPELAQALSGVEVDQQIPVELYQAVAEVIGYVLRTQKKLK